MDSGLNCRVTVLDLDIKELLCDTFAWERERNSWGGDASGDGYSISYDPALLAQYDAEPPTPESPVRRSPRLNFSLTQPAPPTPGRMSTCSEGRMIYRPARHLLFPSSTKLDRDGYTRIRWDGYRTHLIVDRHYRIIVVLAARRAGSVWNGVVTSVTDLLRKTRDDGEWDDVFTLDDYNHNDGIYHTMFTGLSWSESRGPGLLVPDTRERRQIVRTLVEDEDVQRVARFQDFAYSAYAPLSYANAQERLETLYSSAEAPQRPFDSSIFSHVVFDLGVRSIPQVRTNDQSSGSTFSAITTFGTYDYLTGGHMIIEPLRLYVEHPPGNTILAPTALLRTGCTPLSPNQSRMAMTQYIESRLLQALTEGAHAVDKRTISSAERFHNDERWEQVLGRFSTPTSLVQDRERLLPARNFYPF